MNNTLKHYERTIDDLFEDFYEDDFLDDEDYDKIIEYIKLKIREVSKDDE